MKKILIALVVLIMLLVIVTPVFAGGGQVQGGTGNGKGSQETFEKGCTEQPCFDENAEQPKYGP
jgi:hypothetical protein